MPVPEDRIMRRKSDESSMFDYKGPVNLRRDALMTIQGLIGMGEQGPWNPWLLSAASFIVYMYYSLLCYGAEKMHGLRNEVQDPFSTVWLSPPIIFTAMYLWMIRVGKKYMHTRKPQTNLFEIVAVYNGCQAVWNIWIFYRFFIAIYYSDPPMTWWGNEGNEYKRSKDQYTLSFLIWVHYNTRYVELIDTLFIIVRKQWSKMTRLHVTIRIVLLWCWFLVCRYGGGGDSYFGAMAHSFTQIFTYGYYLCTLFNLPCPWKQAVVSMHITQFIVCAIHAIYVLAYVNYNPWLPLLQLVVMLMMLVLFTDFHYQTNQNDPKEETAKVSDKEPRIVISFDSSGWFYLYHFGVAQYIQKYAREEVRISYTGSSGGALIAAVLVTKQDVQELKERALDYIPFCKHNPRNMGIAAKETIEKYIPEHKVLSAEVKVNLKILVTRVSLWRFPFCMGEVLDNFESRDHLCQALYASSNVPMILGIFPQRVKHSKGEGYYYDGMFWSHALGFVPWRSFTTRDVVFRFSTLSSPIRVDTDKKKCQQEFSLACFPLWWALFPPSREVLDGMASYGFIEAQRRFEGRPEFLKPEPIPKEMLEKAVFFVAESKKAWSRFIKRSLTVFGVISVLIFAYT